MTAYIDGMRCYFDSPGRSMGLPAYLAAIGLLSACAFSGLPIYDAVAASNAPDMPAPASADARQPSAALQDMVGNLFAKTKRLRDLEKHADEMAAFSPDAREVYGVVRDGKEKLKLLFDQALAQADKEGFDLRPTGLHFKGTSKRVAQNDPLFPPQPSTGDDLTDLKNDFAGKAGKPKDENELFGTMAELNSQLSRQPVDLSSGASPDLGPDFEKIPTEGVVPDNVRCSATVSNILGDCRKAFNSLGCDRLAIGAKTERDRHTMFCFELWGIKGTNLKFVMSYTQWDREGVTRYDDAIPMSTYRLLMQGSKFLNGAIGQAMELQDRIMRGDKCALMPKNPAGGGPPNSECP